MMKKLSVGLFFLAVIILSQSIFVVKETQRAVKLRFGEVVEADVSPGLHFKLPVVNTVRKFDACLLYTSDAADE